MFRKAAITDARVDLLCYIAGGKRAPVGKALTSMKEKDGTIRVN